MGRLLGRDPSLIVREKRLTKFQRTEEKVIVAQCNRLLQGTYDVMYLLLLFQWSIKVAGVLLISKQK